MACIYKRTNKHAPDVWRVVFRRKGVPTYCICFLTQEKAEQFAKEHESIYVQDYKRFLHMVGNDRLQERRNREFS